MFRALGSGLRAVNLAATGRLRPAQHPAAQRVMCSAAAQGISLVQASSRLGTAGLALGSGSLLVAAGAGYSGGESDDGSPLASSSVPWVQTLASDSQEMLAPGAMLRNHPIAKVLLVDADHLFETMRSNSQIHEFRCFYDPQKKFHSVVQLGKDVCGFPQTVHGGLTAAIIDETFGGLGICLWRSGALGVRLPAYTARLEVDYKKKIPSGSLIQCTTELEKVEGRKVYMRANVTDGKGTTFASARALFVAPRTPVDHVVGWFGFGGRGKQQQQK